MNKELIEDLLACEVVNNVVKLPTTQLNNYAELKKVLTKACGKYKRNTFVFPMDAKPVINSLVSGETIDFKKEFQFFPTPSSVAEEMTNEILGYPKTMLEPSAGHGSLIDAVRKIRPEIKVDAVELSVLNFNVLKEKYTDVNLFNCDFLGHETSKKYDLIIANPPFNKNQDIDHFYKMYKLLNEGGQLITIMSTSWTFGQQKKQSGFREFIEEIGADVRSNENGAFKSSGTMVNSVMVTACK